MSCPFKKSCFEKFICQKLRINLMLAQKLIIEWKLVILLIIISINVCKSLLINIHDEHLVRDFIHGHKLQKGLFILIFKNLKHSIFVILYILWILDSKNSSSCLSCGITKKDFRIMNSPISLQEIRIVILHLFIFKSDESVAILPRNEIAFFWLIIFPSSFWHLVNLFIC